MTAWFYDTVGDWNILKAARWFCSTFNGVGKAADNTVADNYIFTGSRTRTLQYDTVIVRVDNAVGKDKTAATVDVYSVIIAITMIVHFYVIDGNIFAIQIMLIPKCGISHCNTFHMHIFAWDKQNVTRPSVAVAAQSADTPFSSFSFSVYRTFSGNTDVFCIYCIDEGNPATGIFLWTVRCLWLHRKVIVIITGIEVCPAFKM